MALVIKDRIKEVTTTTGTGTVTLGGASTGFRSFADIGNANTTYYCISGGSQFEVGIGTYTASGTTLSRDTVLSNSLGTTALINFSAGSKDVFVTYPSDKALLGDTSAVSSTGTGSVVLSDSPTITGNANLGSATVDIANPTVNIGQGVVGVGQTVNIAQGGEAGIVNIGHSEVGFTASTTTIFGNVILGTNTTDTITFESPTQYTQGITVSSGGINLFGGAANNSSYSTNNTTGSITIGGTTQTGAITLGRSTGVQTVNIATGANNLSAKTVNIGTGAINGATTITLGPTGTVTGATTVNIATQARSSGNTIVNIGTNATGGSTTINLGSLSAFPLINSNGIVQQRSYTNINAQTATAGRKAFVSDHRSATAYPIFGEPYSISGTFGPFNVPVFADGTIWRVG
jgi:hypothetical protein